MSRRRPLKSSTQQIHCRDAQRRRVSVFASAAWAGRAGGSAIAKSTPEPFV
jgi:hypothetical protein